MISYIQIFLTIIYGFIKNQQNDQLSTALLPQLVEPQKLTENKRGAQIAEDRWTRRPSVLLSHTKSDDTFIKVSTIKIIQATGWRASSYEPGFRDLGTSLYPFKKFSTCSYERAGWLGCQDLGFSNRDLGKRAGNFAI